MTRQKRVGLRGTENGPRVSADGEEPGIAEVKQARHADHNIKAQSQGRVDANLDSQFKEEAVAEPRHRHGNEKKSGESHSVREFVERAFAEVGRKIGWRGKGRAERGVCAKTGQVLVEVDARYFRPTEVDRLCGDAAKARRVLGWRHRTSFKALVREMVEADLKAVEQERQRRDRNGE